MSWFYSVHVSFIHLLSQYPHGQDYWFLSNVLQVFYHSELLPHRDLLFSFPTFLLSLLVFSYECHQHVLDSFCWEHVKPLASCWQVKTSLISFLFLFIHISRLPGDSVGDFHFLPSTLVVEILNSISLFWLSLRLSFDYNFVLHHILDCHEFILSSTTNMIRNRHGGFCFGETLTI